MITIPAGLHKVRVASFTSISVTHYYTLVHMYLWKLYDYVVQRCPRQIGSVAAQVTHSPLCWQVLLDRLRRRQTNGRMFKFCEQLTPCLLLNSFWPFKGCSALISTVR
jgi:hypothetical protein